MRTTIPEGAANAAQDQVDRGFMATQPNQLWVADFTDVATWPGMAAMQRRPQHLVHHSDQ